MKFIVIQNFSEMTGIGGIGNGPDMALGSIPVTRRKKKKIKVEFIAARAAVPFAKKLAAPLVRNAMPGLRKLGAQSLGMSTAARGGGQTSTSTFGVNPKPKPQSFGMKTKVKTPSFGMKPKMKSKFGGLSQQQGVRSSF